MENYPPNVALCRETLPPLGIDFKPGSDKEILPFSTGNFDLGIIRYGDFCAEEIFGA